MVVRTPQTLCLHKPIEVKERNISENSSSISLGTGIGQWANSYSRAILECYVYAVFEFNPIEIIE